MNGFTEDACNLPLRAVQFSLVTTTAYSTLLEEELDDLRKAVELVEKAIREVNVLDSGELIHSINIVVSCRNRFKTQ